MSGRRIALAVATGGSATGVLCGLACGGTTGQEGLSLAGTPDASTSASTPLDATVATPADAEEDSGAFEIQYLDQVLPDIATSAPPEDGGVGGNGYPWPNCPPFIAVNARGGPVSLSHPVDEVPADFSDASDSGEVIAADGSVCATYGWLGSTAVDECVTRNSHGSPVGDITLVELPPCVWCEDAGVVTQGTQTGNPRYTVCLALYACISKSGCGASPLGVTNCLCGTENTVACETDPNPPGPCATEELAALEELPSAAMEALYNYDTDTPASGFTGWCAGTLNAIYSNGQSYACFPSDGGAP